MKKIILVISALLVSLGVSAQNGQFTVDKINKDKETYSISYHIKARIQASDGEYDKAFENIDKAIALSPTNDAHLTFKAIMVLKNTLDKNEALPLLETVISTTNESSEAYYFRGVAKRQENNINGACNDFEKAAILNYPLAEDTFGKYCQATVLDVLASIN